MWCLLLSSVIVTYTELMPIGFCQKLQQDPVPVPVLVPVLVLILVPVPISILNFSSRVLLSPLVLFLGANALGRWWPLKSHHRQ